MCWFHNGVRVESQLQSQHTQEDVIKPGTNWNIVLNSLVGCWLTHTRVEVLESCFDFETRARAVLWLKLRGREAIASQAQRQNIPDFCRKSRNISWAQSKPTQFGSRRSKLGSNTVETYPISVDLLTKLKDRCNYKNNQVKGVFIVQLARAAKLFFLCRIIRGQTVHWKGAQFVSAFSWIPDKSLDMLILSRKDQRKWKNKRSGTSSKLK